MESKDSVNIEKQVKDKMVEKYNGGRRRRRMLF
jgi:hypothetical protein